MPPSFFTEKNRRMICDSLQDGCGKRCTSCALRHPHALREWAESGQPAPCPCGCGGVEYLDNPAEGFVEGQQDGE